MTRLLKKPLNSRQSTIDTDTTGLNHASPVASGSILERRYDGPDDTELVHAALMMPESGSTL